MTTMLMQRIEINRMTQSTNSLAGFFIAYLSYRFYTDFSLYFVRYFNACWKIQDASYQVLAEVKTPDVFRWLLFAYVAYGLYRMIKGYGVTKNLDLVNATAKFFAGHRAEITEAEKQSALLFCVKFFFLPIMLNALVQQADLLNAIVVRLYTYFSLPDFGRIGISINWPAYLVHIALVIIYFVDLVPFVLGYLLDDDALDNSVKSVDTSGFAWFICLICYNPFSFALNSVFPVIVPEYVQQFRQLGTNWTYMHYVLNVLAVSCMAVYALASVSLGLKASNMTSRGVVQTGVYRICRHPAYAFKNLGWWLFGGAYAFHQYLDGKPWMYLIFCLAFRTIIYYVRALTEEAHLSRTDPDYGKYAQVVKYRFIPGLL